MRGVLRGVGERPLLGALGELGALVLLELHDLALHLGAQAVDLGARPRLVLREALLEAVHLLVRLAQLLVRVVEPRLEALLALDGLLAVERQLRHLLVGGDEAPLEPERLLLEVAAPAVELAHLVAVVEDLALLRVHAVAKVEDVLLFLVDDLAQAEELALFGEGRRQREALARLVELAAHRLALALERVDARLELRVLRLELARADVITRDGDAERGLHRRLPRVRHLDAHVLGLRDVDVLDAHGVDGRVGVGAHALGTDGGTEIGPQRLARAVGVGIGDDRRVGLAIHLRLAVGTERVRRQRLLLADGRRHRRLILPPDRRRQVVVVPEVAQVDHVAAARRPLGRTGLERRERRLRLGIELLALERRGRLGIGRRGDALAVSVLVGHGRRGGPAHARERAVLVGLDVVRAPDDRDVLVIRDDDVRVHVQLLDVHLVGLLLAAEPHELVQLRRQVLDVERLEQVLVGARLQLLVLLERRERLLRRDEHERHLAQARAALELVADGIADLARLDREDDERRLVRAPPLDGLVPVRNALDREPVWLQLTPDLIHGRAVGFDAQQDALGHRVPS